VVRGVIAFGLARRKTYCVLRKKAPLRFAFYVLNIHSGRPVDRNDKPADAKN
jgi:hypothetical protein